jgi:hypothetical protein
MWSSNFSNCIFSHGSKFDFNFSHIWMAIWMNMITDTAVQKIHSSYIQFCKSWCLVCPACKNDFRPRILCRCNYIWEICNTDAAHGSVMFPLWCNCNSWVEKVATRSVSTHSRSIMHQHSYKKVSLCTFVFYLIYVPPSTSSKHSGHGVETHGDIRSQIYLITYFITV